MRAALDKHNIHYNTMPDGEITIDMTSLNQQQRSVVDALVDGQDQWLKDHRRGRYQKPNKEE